MSAKILEAISQTVEEHFNSIALDFLGFIPKIGQQKRITFTSAPNASSAVAGDLSGNGRDDLVVLSNGGVQVHVQGLPGVFTAMDFHSGTFACVDIADANFDGSLDVLTVRNRPGLRPLIEIHEYDGGGLSACSRTMKVMTFRLSILSI